MNGPDDEIERNAPGGWAQGRYQHRAEDSWEHNAVRVAEELVPALRRNAVRLLLLSGDIRAVQFLQKHLPGPLKHELVIRHVSGGRSPDGADRLRAEQVADDVACAVAARTEALLTELDDERRPGGRAVEGTDATLEALAESRVQVLLIAPDEAGADRPAWFGPGGTDVAADPETLGLRGVPPQRGRLVDAAVRAALLTRADVRVLSPGADLPRDGIGALCRFR